jgi:hypothetical protein
MDRLRLPGHVLDRAAVRVERRTGNGHHKTAHVTLLALRAGMTGKTAGAHGYYLGERYVFQATQIESCACRQAATQHELMCPLGCGVDNA